MDQDQGGEIKGGLLPQLVEVGEKHKHWVCIDFFQKKFWGGFKSWPTTLNKGKNMERVNWGENVFSKSQGGMGRGGFQALHSQPLNMRGGGDRLNCYSVNVSVGRSVAKPNKTGRYYL